MIKIGDMLIFTDEYPWETKCAIVTLIDATIAKPHTIIGAIYSNQKIDYWYEDTLFDRLSKFRVKEVIHG